MTHQLHQLFASPTGGALPYPSSTPYPSRTNTPAFTASISSHSSSSGSYSHKSQSSWKAPWKSSSARKTPKRAQTAPWKGSDPMAYYGYYQQQAPGWGNTAEYQPLPPPVPTYQPASNCEQFYQIYPLQSPRRLPTPVPSQREALRGISLFEVQTDQE